MVQPAYAARMSAVGEAGADVSASAAPEEHRRGWGSVRARWVTLSVGAVSLGVGAVNSFWGVGSQSLFNDEAGTWVISSGPLAGLIHRLNKTEIVPPLYYGLLHGWLRLVGSQTEAALRVPSALTAVALVAVVGWLGLLLAGRTAGGLAAALAALSPCTVIYAQQARAYAPTMLAVAGAAVALTLALRSGSVRWLATSALAAGIAVALHYTAWLVVAPMCVAVAMSSSVSRRAKRAYVAWCGLVAALNTPILVTQLERGRADHSSAGLTLHNVIDDLGAPFGGRLAERWPVTVGAVIVLAAVAVLVAVTRRTRPRQERLLLLACAVIPGVVTLALTVFGARVLWARYVAVAVPFLFVAVATAVASQRGVVVRGALAAVVLVIAAAASVLSHRGHYAYYGDIRGAVLTATALDTPGDVLVNGTGDLTLDATTRYYAYRFFPGGQDQVIPSTRPAVAQALARRQRVWAITAVASPNSIGRSVAGQGGVLDRIWRYPGVAVVQLNLVAPRRG